MGFDRQHDHDHGLAHDLAIMEGMVGRRRALVWFAGVGAGALLTGCGSGASSDSTATTSSAAAATTVGTTTTTGTTTTSTTTTTTTSGGSCIADAAETSGPYPADGTNTSSGATSDVLTASGIVRSDIRPSFISSTTVATGVQLTLTLTLVNVNNSCAALSGYAIYVWCADREGHYSLYSAPTESYLRGVQVTDANGQVTFQMIVPACYDGRWPHLHFEVFASLAAATNGKYATLTSQLAMPAAVGTAVYADSTTYPSSATNFAKVSLSSDQVFGDDSSAQLAEMTPTFTGTPSAGYSATATIGLAL